MALLGLIVDLAKVFFYVFEAFLDLVFPISWIRGVRYPVRGKTAVVTGAAYGIGRATAIELAKKGSNVVLIDVNEKGLQEAADEVRKYTSVCHYFICDVSNKTDVEEVGKRIESTVGDVDILVNNAGVIVIDSFLNITPEQCERIIRVNLLAHFWTLRTFLPAMIRRKSGYIVSVSSYCGLSGGSKLSAYSATKFGVVGLHESVRNELYDAGLGDKVNMTLVLPWAVNTRMLTDDTSAPEAVSLLIDPKVQASKIVESILYKRETLIFPRIVRIVALLHQMFPPKAQIQLDKIIGFADMLKSIPRRDTIPISLLPGQYR